MFPVLQPVHGHATDALVEVTVRWRGPSPAPCLSDAEIVGPYSQLGRTIVARFPLVPDGRGRWRTQVIDPLFWTPDQPARYRLRAKLPAALSPLITEFGIRRIEAARGSIWLDRRRWVFRGVWQAASASLGIEELAAAPLGLLLDTPAPDLTGEATQRGVPLLMRSGSGAWRENLAQMTLPPACLMVALPAEAGTTREELDDLAPNTLKVAEFVEENRPQIPEWCDAMLAPAAPWLLEQLRQAAPNRPLLAWKRAAPLESVASARRAAELLQQQLTPDFDLSGYVVC